jgi:hypothetical protein
LRGILGACPGPLEIQEDGGRHRVARRHVAQIPGTNGRGRAGVHRFVREEPGEYRKRGAPAGRAIVHLPHELGDRARVQRRDPLGVVEVIRIDDVRRFYLEEAVTIAGIDRERERRGGQHRHRATDARLCKLDRVHG